MKRKKDNRAHRVPDVCDPGRRQSAVPLAATLLALALIFSGGCLAIGQGSVEGAGPGTVQGANPGDLAVPDDWAARVHAAIVEEFPGEETRVFFPAPPRPAKIRYRYWMERRMEGLAGLAVVRSLDGRALLGGGRQAWQAVYLLTPEGGIGFLSARLEWIDVDPPLYALEVVDQTHTNTTRLARPVGLTPEAEKALGAFMAAPLGELSWPFEAFQP
ncbi:MAG: hypothetical protein LBL95_08935, partial [Deltaproteobacteria bacterium]|jgi:hypothetical protein|nr:hypothetical protein [Deltaproteobacteria bacterium]